MDCGCNTLPPCRSMTKPCWSLRHDHNQGTHGSDGIVNYERASWRAVKILTVGGFAAVGADTRQGLLVTSSFRGHQRPTCHLTDSRDCLKHLSRHRRNSSSSEMPEIASPQSNQVQRPAVTSRQSFFYLRRVHPRRRSVCFTSRTHRAPQ